LGELASIASRVETSHAVSPHDCS